MTLLEYVVSHIVNLIKIKSLLTLALTATFVVLALRGEIAPDQFLTIFTTVVAFYFGSQVGKKEDADTAKEESNSNTVIEDAPTNSSAITEPREDE